MKDNSMQSVGNSIKKYRRYRNLTQKEFARMIMLSKRQVEEIEAGHSWSSIDVLFKISLLLDIPFDILFKDCDKKFIVYSIEEYIRRIDKEKASFLLEKISNLIG